MSLNTRHTACLAIASLVKTAEVQIDDEGTKIKLADYPALYPGTDGEADVTMPVGAHCMEGRIGDNGEIPEEWTGVQLPAVIVACTRAEAAPAGYDICEISVLALSSVEERDAPAKHAARIGYLSALFDEWSLDAVTAALNAPESGEDARPVKNLIVIGIERAGEEHGEEGAHVAAGVRLRVHGIATA